MPDKARQEIVLQGEIGTYQCWSRCVQRAFLCGCDAVTGIDFNYRRVWMESLLEYQAGVFAMDVGSAVMKELAETLLNWGLNPRPWVVHLHDVVLRCHHLLGNAELVESRAKQDAQRCYYGMTFCRDVFGSPKPTAAEFP